MDRQKIKQAFRDGKLLVKSMNRKDGAIDWKSVQDVMRHSSLGKRILKVVCDETSVTVTEDHSLFESINNDVCTKALQPGDKIVVDDNGIARQRDITEIKEMDSREYMYDLSVPEYENFVLNSGIIAHNSYSISGVSLDIEKSSKYQSMKDEYINEYDKLVEAAKRSIKILRGLQQPRYGVGVTSALGPLSRPGVQSRRNFISSFRPVYI